MNPLLRKLRATPFVALLIFVPLAAAAVSLSVGRYAVHLGDALEIIFRVVKRGYAAAASVDPQERIIIGVRLPRVLLGLLVGGGLSVAGAGMQALLSNPLVSPDTLGVASGACFGAALAILLGLGYAVTTASSFLFGLIAVGLTYLVGRLSRIRSPLAMVLTGVMVSSLFSAGTSFIKLVADTNEQLPAITYWLMGALTSVRLDDLHFAMVPILLGLIPLFFLRWRLNLLTVSEAEARSMGVNTRLLRFVIIICATLATAASVSISGMIGWVGLVIPHICRLLVGQDTKKLLPASMLLGASFLMLVDDLARCLATSESPLGILTAFVGAPMFLYLIIKGGMQRAD